MQIRQFSKSTIRNYLYYNKLCAAHAETCPEKLTETNVRAFLLHCAEEREYSAGSINLAANAIEFLFRHILHRPLQYELPRSKRGRKLPVVFSTKEILELFRSVPNLKHRTILTLIYSSGLRVGEAVRLKPADIDPERGLVHVRQSKGKKDRYTVLSSAALDLLRQYTETYRPIAWLFPGSGFETHLTTRSVKACPGNAKGWHTQKGRCSFLAAFICHAPFRAGCRFETDSGAFGACQS